MMVRTRTLRFFLIGATILGAGFVLGQGLTVNNAGPLGGATPALADNGSALPIRSDGSSILADVAAQVGPAVVFIKTERNYRNSDQRSDAPWDFFRDYFDRQDTPRDNNNNRRFHGEGGGSGFVFDDEGRIFTNHHVIRDADQITVLLDGEEYEAEVVGADPLTDIAIIQIDPPRGMKTVSLGNSDGMRVGDWVMAIGTPFGTLQGSVTAGIVSAVGRNDLRIAGGQAIYQNYIQTDASINFGNSGGPLVNLRGEAIGINTAINPSGQGIGFAIPINMARNIMGQLIEDGKVSYGYMGIGLQELDADLAEGRGIKVDRGILVTQVLDKTPASDAGIRQGDVIVGYAGQRVDNESEFRMRVANTSPGTRVPIVVHRSGDELDLDIEIGTRPDPNQIAQQRVDDEGVDTWLGLHVDEASKREYRRQYGMDSGQDGVVVVGVDPGSPAAESGLQEGDIITEVYTHEVKGLEDYVSISEKLKDRKAAIAFLVKRGRTTTYVTVNPESGDE